jgi:hypothetical protein
MQYFRPINAQIADAEIGRSQEIAVTIRKVGAWDVVKKGKFSIFVI